MCLPHPSGPSGYPQTQIELHLTDPDCPSMAETIFVLWSPCAVSLTSQVFPPSPRPVDSISQAGCSSDTGQSTPYHMNAVWLVEEEMESSETVRDVLLSSRKLFVRATYLSKGEWFLIWATSKGIHPMSTWIQNTLDYLLQLKTSDVALSCLKVHVAVISAFYPPMWG